MEKNNPNPFERIMKYSHTPLPNPKIPWTKTIGGRLSTLVLVPLGTSSLTTTFVLLALNKHSFRAWERSPATAELNM